MERHLRSIATEETELEIVTVKQLVGECDSKNINNLLRRKFGSAVYYITASNFYGIHDDDSIADQIVNTTNTGVFAYYGGIKEVLINRGDSMDKKLSIVNAEERTLACFNTIDATLQRDKRLRNYEESIVSAMSCVGVDLDEQVSVQTLQDILARIGDEIDYAYRPKLRSV